MVKSFSKLCRGKYYGIIQYWVKIIELIDKKIRINS